jgi:hydroxymethylpyrimidine pyrophosphatase-like HAD family hydrolase
MRFPALASDYDGTLATHGVVDRQTVSALERFARTGRKLLLVTGRELPDLKRVFSRLDLFDLIVAENGALLYNTISHQETLLCSPAPAALASELRGQGIPVSLGRAILASTDLHLDEVRQAIARSGMDLHVILNKGSLMVLPAGINKASGLSRALAELGLTLDEVAAVGDAENDIDFLEACGYAVAVANALPALKSRADLVTIGAHGAGVAEFIDRVLRDGVPRRRSGGHGRRSLQSS